MKRLILVPAAALLLAGCVGSPSMQAGLARADDDTCRSMTFAPGTFGYQNCRMSLHGQHIGEAERRREAFQDGLANIAGSIHASDAYSHYQPLGGDRFQTTCTTYPNSMVTTTTCN